MFIEPALTARAGYKSVKVYGQLGLAMPTMPITYNYRPLMLSMGVNIKIAQRYKDKPSSN
jgi:DNA mismatch repair protein MutH